MLRLGTLIFTDGGHKITRDSCLNIRRTVAETIVALSKQYDNVSIADILLAIQTDINIHLVDKGLLSEEDGNNFITRQQIVTALHDITSERTRRQSKYIPDGIEKVTGVYYRYNRGDKHV